MQDAKKTRLGFIGVGRMGAPMAGRLIDAGYELTIYDTNDTAVETLVAKGAQRAASPKAVADVAEIVFLSLPIPSVVLAVGLGEDGVVKGQAVRTVVDLSTTGAEAAKELAQGLKAANIETIDCPVSGGVAGATKGTLALMASGAAAQFDEIKPMLDVLGKAFYVGAGAGLGQTMKVLNNLISVTSLAITSEVMVAGAKAGLDADAMVDVINAGSGRTTASSDKIPNFVLSRGFNFGFAIGLSAKDVRLALEESTALGVPMKIGSATREFLNEAVAKLGDQADMTEMIRLLEEAAGVEVVGKAGRAAT